MAPRGGHAAAASSVSEEEAGFSRSYFLAKEKEPSSGKKRARAAAGKLSDLNLVDEQVRCPALNHFLTSRSTNPWVGLTDL
jgi:origin recognition complex subunit 2